MSVPRRRESRPDPLASAGISKPRGATCAGRDSERVADRPGCTRITRHQADKRPWPKTLPEQAQAVRAVLAEHPAGLTPEQLARLFLRANTKLVSELLQTLVSLGQARVLESGAYVRT